MILSLYFKWFTILKSRSLVDGITIRIRIRICIFYDTMRYITVLTIFSTFTFAQLSTRQLVLFTRTFFEQLLFTQPHLTNSTTAEGAENKSESFGMNLLSDIYQPKSQASSLIGLQMISWFHADAWKWALRITWCQAPGVGGPLSIHLLPDWALKLFHLTSPAVSPLHFLC